MYKEIASNKRKTAALIIIFTIVLFCIGYAYGRYYDDYESGLLFALIISFGMNFIGYFASDKIALMSSGAKVIKKNDFPELYRIIENLSITAGTPMPRVAVINDQSMNAFATGRNPKHAVIAVTTGLLQRLTKTEIEGVIAHEMSHIKNYDILLMTTVVVLVGTVALLADMTRFGIGGKNRSEKNGSIFLVIAVVMLILSPLIGQLIKLAISRKREYLADASGALLTRYPEGLASALEKIGGDSFELRRANHATAHLFISSPFKGNSVSNLLSTHPPIQDRINKLRNML